jgi:hypothetical protein
MLSKRHLEPVMSPAVEAARSQTTQALSKQFQQATAAVRKEFVQLLVARAPGNQSPTATAATAVVGGGVGASEPVTTEFAQQWFDASLMALVKERENKFYELMTTAFRGELHRQVRLVVLRPSQRSLFLGTQPHRVALSHAHGVCPPHVYHRSMHPKCMLLRV